MWKWNKIQISFSYILLNNKFVLFLMKNNLNYSENSKRKLSTVYCGERQKEGKGVYSVILLCRKKSSKRTKAILKRQILSSFMPHILQTLTETRRLHTLRFLLYILVLLYVLVNFFPDWINYKYWTIPIKNPSYCFFTTILLFLLYVLFGKFPSIYKYTYWLIWKI